MTTTSRGLILFLALLVPSTAAADAQVNEWIGEYAMNHDGFIGKLVIEDSNVYCTAAVPWCRLRMTYFDDKGARHDARLMSLDQAFQHAVFVIDFGGTPQQFDGYLMSWDKSKIAGVSHWGGRTFGFYAVKEARLARPRVRPGSPQAPTTPGPATSAKPTVKPDGTVVVSMPDGGTRLSRPGECGFTILTPDGLARTMSCVEVQRAEPPAVPDATMQSWLDAHDEALLSILRGVLTGDDMNNYLSNFETPPPSVYGRIRLRTQLIGQLFPSR